MKKNSWIQLAEVLERIGQNIAAWKGGDPFVSSEGQ